MDGGRGLTLPPDDPNWPRASAWLAGDHVPEPDATLAVLGVPIRLGSISGGRFDLAPAAIREALARYSTFTDGIDVLAVSVTDVGDLSVAESKPQDALLDIVTGVRGGLRDADVVALLGGDNSITAGGVRGLGELFDTDVGLVTLDAHHDVRDIESGLTNGNPIRALLADGFPGENIVQIGIQPFANSARYADVAREAGITVVPVGEARSRGVEVVVGEALDDLASRVEAIYVDLDLDVLDRAFAPACPGSRPGGLAPWELQAAARRCGVHPSVKAIDLVEVDPTKDVADVTVLAAASFLLSFAAGVASRSMKGDA